jgi:uncharacterized protein (TIGR02996 family)
MPPSNLDALLRACKGDPTNDEVRRILADFLEEDGQAERAEFVRLQIALPEEEDRREWHPLAAEREARQIRLLRKNAADWLGGAWNAYGWVGVPSENPGHSASVKFARGLACVQVGKAPCDELPLALGPGAAPWLERFEAGRILEPDVWAELCRGPLLEGFSDLGIHWEDPDVGTLVGLLERARPAQLGLNMDEAEPGLLATLAAAPWFRPHVLSLENFAGWEAFAASPALWEVRNLSLHVRDEGFPLVALASSANLGNIRKLFLNGDGMGAALGRLLESDGLAGVRELAITSYDGSGSPGIAPALRECQGLPALRDLDLFMNPLDRDEAAQLAQSPALAGVRILKLHSCALDGPAARNLFASPHLANLECLDLSCNPIGDVGLKALATAPTLNKLRQLDLCKSEVGPAGLRALVASPRFGQLQTLELSGNPLGEEGFQILAGAAGCRLQMLHLANTQPGRAGWQALARSGVLRQVSELSAGSAGVGPQEAADLAAADGLEALRVLALGFNPLGVEGARALAGAPWLDQLVVLYLDNAQIGDDGLIALLSRLPAGTLGTLWLQKNGLGERGGRALLEWPGLAHLTHLWIEDGGLGGLADEIRAVPQASR